ncbi:MAG: M20/M25/M40 family metallo-hydrolase, partial [Thermofilum sp.]|nr:M20/M25/M40 family metallo-hydrolase [Thermofilum sp.]
MPLDIVQALSELVTIPSEVYYVENKLVRKHYREAADAVARIAESNGLKVERIDLEGGEIPTLIITLPNPPKSKPSVAFVSHYDVVPAKGPWKIDGEEIDPYTPIVRDGKLYGRGSADDKSGIVASIAGLVDLKESGAELAYNPVVIVTGDEEVGGTGIRRLLESGARWDHV